MIVKLTIINPFTSLPGGLGSFGESFRGFSEEGRTRGFPSPPFGGFGFVVATTNYSREFEFCQLGYLNRIFQATGNVAFGSEPEVYRIFLGRLLWNANQSLRCDFHRKLALNVSSCN